MEDGQPSTGIGLFAEPLRKTGLSAACRTLEQYDPGLAGLLDFSQSGPQSIPFFEAIDHGYWGQAIETETHTTGSASEQPRLPLP
jgi:hypothetical protein